MVLQTTLANLAFQDVAAMAFHAFMLVRVSLAPTSPDGRMAQQIGLALLSLTATSILLTRGELLPAGRARGVIYRLGTVTPVVLSYFQLHYLLPALEPVLVDDLLRRVDEALVGVTPAAWFERFNEPPIVEWFAFFYYSYFFVMAAVLVPSLFLDRGLRLGEVMIGAVIIGATGHILYTFVPGVGPYGAMDFEGPLRGGMFWRQVLYAVENAGAQLDIFPSLHTAYPSFFALHAIRWRRTRPFRIAWPALAFIAANIIVATMFLRWHWLIDVLVGFTLAVVAQRIAVRVAGREIERGRRDDRQPVWEPLHG